MMGVTYEFHGFVVVFLFSYPLKDFVFNKHTPTIELFLTICLDYFVRAHLAYIKITRVGHRILFRSEGIVLCVLL